MFRGVLMIVLTLIALLGALAGVIDLGLKRIDAAKKAADAAWHAPTPVAALAPTTGPSALPTDHAYDDLPPKPEVASIELWAKDAILHGDVQLADSITEHHKVEPPPRNDREVQRRKTRLAMGGRPVLAYLSNFKGPGDCAEWAVELPKAGNYEIDLTYACPKWKEGGKFILRLGEKELKWTTEATRHNTNFRVITVGTLTLPAGKTRLMLRPAEIGTHDREFINLRSVQIIPAD